MHDKVPSQAFFFSILPAGSESCRRVVGGAPLVPVGLYSIAVLEERNLGRIYSGEGGITKVSGRNRFIVIPRLRRYELMCRLG